MYKGTKSRRINKDYLQQIKKTTKSTENNPICLPKLRNDVKFAHTFLADMRFIAFIQISVFSTAWIAVGFLLLALLLLFMVLFLLRSREVTALKKEIRDLRDTIRMMRYEETNMARMLHTAHKQIDPEAKENKKEKNIEEIETRHTSIQDAVDVATTHEATPTTTAEKELQNGHIEVAKGEVEKGYTEEHPNITPQPHKQPINERQPAIPNDLFAAWFAENEGLTIKEDVKEEAEMTVPEENNHTNSLETANSPEECNETDRTSQENSKKTDSNEERTTKLSKEDERFCRKLERIVNARLHNPNLNVDTIASQFGIGRTNFYRKVRELTGMSPNDFLRKCRMERAAELLSSTEVAVSEVCAQVGIPDAQYFSRVFKAHFGVSPSAYRESNNQ